MTDLEDKYQYWAASIDLFKKGKTQQVMMTMSFYSGVLVMFTLMEKVSVEGSEEKGVKMLDDTYDELKEKMAFISEEMDEIYKD